MDKSVIFHFLAEKYNASSYKQYITSSYSQCKYDL